MEFDRTSRFVTGLLIVFLVFQLSDLQNSPFTSPLQSMNGIHPSFSDPTDRGGWDFFLFLIAYPEVLAIITIIAAVVIKLISNWVNNKRGGKNE